LNIEEEEITDADMAAINAEAVAAAPAQSQAAPPPQMAQPPQAAAPAAPSQASYIEELKSLAELRDAGIITAEDFEAKKKSLLGL